MSKHIKRHKKRAAASVPPASGTDIHNVSDVAQKSITRARSVMRLTAFGVAAERLCN